MTGWEKLLTASQPLAQQFVQALTAPRSAQLELLRRIVRANTSTDYGRAFGFTDICDYDAFQRRVPISTYEDLRPWINRCAAGEPEVLTSEPVVAFEQTSGSTSGSKLIPYTSSSLLSFRAAVLPWVHDLAQRRPAITTGTAYIAVSPATRPYSITAGGIPIGLPSDGAYLGDDLAPAFADILAIDHRIGSITELRRWQLATLEGLVRCRNLTFISIWSPSFLLRLADFLVNHLDEVMPRLANDGEATERLSRATSGGSLDTTVLWPQLDTISCWADGPSEVLARQLAQRFPAAFMEPKGILATESAITLPHGTQQGAVPALLSAFIEFVDDSGTPHLVDELAEDSASRIIITTSGGLYRYDIGDRVICTGHSGEVPRLRFLGRAGVVSDLVGEKLTDDFVSIILADLACQAMLVARIDPTPHYELWLDTNDEDVAAFAGKKTETGLSQNPQYAYARALGQLQQTVAVCRPGFLRARHDRLVADGRRLGDLKAIALLPVITSP